MSGKPNSFSEKQSRDGVQSDHKLRVSGIRRSPFADITNNILDSRLRRHNEPTSPPPQSRTVNGGTVPNENVARNFDSGDAQNRRVESVAPLRNRRSFRPSPSTLTSRIGFPSSLDGACNTSPVKADSEVPSVSPLGSVPQLTGNTLRSRPSRRQTSFGSGALNQYPHDPGLCGESTREPLSTSLLAPKTHKLAGGQLAILPSRSVLVDFREGERRKGKKGEEVMVVSPNGDQIHLFSAPHLSTPCCLAEPIATYSLGDLPADQYKLYEQAKKVIEHIKRNVTKVVMYEGNYVCTLMANGPRADIEIRTNPRSTPTTISASMTTSIRIRFSRKLRTMQIFSSETNLCKKTMFCTARGVPTDAGDWALLSANEKECLAALLDFLRVVEAVEGLPRDASEPLSAVSAERQTGHSTKREATHSAASAIPPHRENDVYPPGASLPKSATMSSTVPPPSTRPTQVTVSPRPRFPSAIPRASSDTSRKASSTAVGDAPPLALPSEDRPSSLAACTEDVGSLRDLSATGRSRLQTRFMPGVGWCVRSGSARYRIMFTDGVALEVDVDEERVEMVECDGSVVRYTVRECSASRKVGDRMKVFRKFLPLFDESDF